MLIALTSPEHIHYAVARHWFYANPALQWRLCAFSEAGLLRYLCASSLGGATVSEAASILRKLTEHPGYSYLPIAGD